MKHQKIKLVLSLDRLNVEVSKKIKKKNFQQFLRFQDHFLSFLENRIFFKNQAFLHAAPMIFVILSSKATKKKKKLRVPPHSSLSLGAPYINFYKYLFSKVN